jgi:hypothetical protein
MLKILKTSEIGMLPFSEIYEQVKVSYSSGVRKTAMNKILKSNKIFLALDEINWTVDPRFDCRFDIESETGTSE